MGLFDEMSGALQRGRGTVERTGKAARLRLQLSELGKRRGELAAQLGASLYPLVRDNPSLREGREPLLDAMAALDKQRKDIEQEIARIEAEANAARAATQAARRTAQANRNAGQGVVCPNCGTLLENHHAFCTGCGMSAEKIRAAVPQAQGFAPAEAAQSGPKCVHCGAQLEGGDLFCIACGAKQDVPSNK